MDAYRTLERGSFARCSSDLDRTCRRAALARCCACPRSPVAALGDRLRRAADGPHPTILPYRRALRVMSAAAIAMTLGLSALVLLTARETRRLVDALAAKPETPVANEERVEHVVLTDLRGLALATHAPVARITAVPRGLLIEDVAPGSLPAAAGIENGDVITAVDGRPIARPEAASRAYDDALAKHHAVVDVIRRNKPLRIDLVWKG